MTAASGPRDLASTSERALDLRLARLHLRSGSLALARAELESFVGSGELDADALVDLAEVRWRTGDLAGAGDAALAGLDRGADWPLTLVIAAEAASAAGLSTEALGYVDRVAQAGEVDLDAVFAGMPRSPIWPADEGPRRGAAPIRPEGPPSGEPGQPGGPAGALAGSGAEAPNPVPRSGATGQADLSRAQAELAAGRLDAAAVRLALILRATPNQANLVIELIGERSEPALAIVLGDAHRIAGDDERADAAWAAARAGLAGDEFPAGPEVGRGAAQASDAAPRPRPDATHGPTPGPNDPPGGRPPASTPSVWTSGPTDKESS